jgi:hypothetical protein
VTSFDARLRVPGQRRIPISVVVDVAEDQISFSRGDQLLADWPLAKIDVVFQPDGFHLKLDEEEVILNVVDVDRFAKELRVRGPAPQPKVTTSPRPESNGYTASQVAERLEKVTPEERFQDVRSRIDELAADLLDNAVTPQDVFGRWLRLLKEINMRHGQGAMPTALFHRFNTELLEMIPAPRKPSPEATS